MFCPVCGSPIPESARFCPICQSNLSEDRQWLQEAKNPNTQTTYEDRGNSPSHLTIPGEYNQQDPYDTSSRNQIGFGTSSSIDSGDDDGWRWYKLCVSFVFVGIGALDILGALLIVVTIFVRPQFLSETLTPIFQQMGPAVLLYIPFGILLGIFNIGLRGRLARLERSALPVLYALCGISLVLNTLLAFVARGALGLISVIPMLVFVVLNVLYYHRRQSFFDN